MSKFVKNLVGNHLKECLQGVDEALFVDVIGLDANRTTTLRRELREKEINLMVVKNSLAHRATEGTPLGEAFEGVEGSMAIVWGSEDLVSLAKQVVALAENPDYQEFQTRGGIMDGGVLSSEAVKQVSKWPSRQEQLGILVGQILSPGAVLAGQLQGPGGNLASQIQEKAKEAEDE